MFTGIIENQGLLASVEQNGGNKTFWISSPISPELKIDQSLAHNGICLTVEEVKGNQHRVTAVAETLQKTNAGNWRAGDHINLERAMLLNARLDGHLVQGHVDTTGNCLSVVEASGSWIFAFEFPSKFADLIIEKGSITVNGISLTAFDVEKTTFKVAIIPYTHHHTNIQFLKTGDPVNLEFDLIGKYIHRSNSINQHSTDNKNSNK
ncbi:MAG: riboflavin synthase [Chitinophagaceae bacterium]